MNNFEKKLLEKVEKYLPHIVFVVVTLVGFYMRFYMRTIVSGDAHTCLMPWYNEIAENGLYHPVGDYSLLYQFVIWIMTRFPTIPNLFAFKIFMSNLTNIFKNVIIYIVWHSILVKRVPIPRWA